jgi:adenylate cyclase
VDARFGVRGAQAPDQDLVLVGIDRRTLADGYDRAMLARAIGRIAQAGPRAIALDLIAKAPATTPAADQALKDAVAAHGRAIVAATAEIDTSTGTGLAADFMGSPGFLERAGARPGYAGMPADEDGIARRVEYQLPASPSLRYPTFAFVVARRADPRVDAQTLPSASRWALAEQSAGNAWIDFAGGPGAYPVESLADVAQGRVAPGLLTDRIVLVGFADGRNDVHRAATAHGPPMNGMELQANAIATLLRHAPLRDAPAPASLLAVALLGLLPLAVWLLGGPAWRKTLLVAAAVAAFLVLAQLVFDGGRIVAVTEPLIALLLALAGIALAEGRRALRRPPTATSSTA